MQIIKLNLFTDKLLKELQIPQQESQAVIADLENLPTIKGTYILLFYNEIQKNITVGKLGTFCIKKGVYMYVGSAFGPGGLKSRISRHAQTNKKLKWHIDYLRNELSLFNVIVSPSQSKLECIWAENLYNLDYSTPFKGFGSSDCKCFSHLFFSKLN